MSSVAVSVRGRVKELGSGPLPRLLEKNPYMQEIYPTPESQKALTVFQLYAGSGDWLDLSQKPIERFSFSFGEAQAESEGYFITDACAVCRACEAVCPQGCIDFTSVPPAIRQEPCLRAEIAWRLARRTRSFGRKQNNTEEGAGKRLRRGASTCADIADIRERRPWAPRLTVGRDQRASEGIFVIKCVASRFPSHGHADPLPKYAAAASVKIPHEHADRAGLLCGLEKFLVPHIDRIPASDV